MKQYDGWVQPEEVGDEFGTEFDYYDRYPQDDPFQTVDELETETLAYKDNVVERLVNVLHEYMSFSSVRDLVKLIVDNDL